MTLHPTSLRTLPAMVRHHADRDADRRFLADEQGVLSWSQMHEVARGMQAAFEDLGVGPGDTVGVMLDNRREFLESWFGLGFGGAIEVPIKPANVGQRLVHVLNHSQCRIVVVQAEYVGQIERERAHLTHLERIVVVGDGGSSTLASLPWSELQRDPDTARDVTVRFSDPVAVLYTSGSTGPAKGALVPHGQHYMNGYQPASLFDIGPDDDVFVCLPLDHNMAQGYGVMPAVVGGASVTIVPRFEATRFWDQVRAAGSTVLPFVGVLLVLLVKQPARDDDRDNPLRVGYGIPIPPDIHAEFERRFGFDLSHAYGSTEATIVAWGTGDDRVLGASGPIFPSFEVQIVDDQDLPVPTGEQGQICVRPVEPFSMFEGYFRDPEKTAQAFRNLWFHSGDDGRIDADGRLWFVDRRGDVIRRLGESISSYEVEQALVGHPAVQLVAAYAVPSELVEEEVMVSIVLQPGASLTAQELRGWLVDRLPRYAIPRFVRFTDALPMTPTGKVEKYLLRELGRDGDTFDARAQE